MAGLNYAHRLTVTVWTDDVDPILAQMALRNALNSNNNKRGTFHMELTNEAIGLGKDA